MRFPFASLLFLSLAAAACGSADADVGADEADHTAKQPVHANAPYFWAETDYASFKEVAQAAPFRTGTPLDGTGAVTKRLQAWADLVHAQVQKDVPGLVAPKPVIVVVPAKEANAWVSGVPSCFTAEADLRAIGKKGRPAKSVNMAFAEHDGIKEAVSFFGAPPPTCTNPKNWKSKEEAIAFFNRSGSRCKLERGAGDTVKVSGEGCAMLSGDTGATTAKQLTFYAASPYVHFTTAMIGMANDERGLVGIIAHELGHYYRAHAIGELVMGAYNHWYEQKDPPEKTKPGAAADTKELEARFDRVMPYPMPRVPGQKISYRLTDLVVDPLAALLEAKKTSPGFACADAVAKLGDWRHDFTGLGASFVEKATQTSYLAYESALLACAAKVPVGGNDPNALDLATVREAVERSARDFAAPAVSAGTLASVLDALRARAAVVDAEADAFLKTLEQRRLGRYTVEQEADDFSLEYFTRIGLEAKVRVDSYFDLIKARADETPERFIAANGGLDVPACEKLYRANFRGRSGELLFVPLGNLHDPHHGDCYRLFNMAQEQRAHRFRKRGTPAFTTGWEEIRAEAQRATDAFKPPVFGGGGPFQLPQRSSGPGGGVIVDGL